MSKFELLARRLFVLFGLAAGCGDGTQARQPPAQPPTTDVTLPPGEPPTGPVSPPGEVPSVAEPTADEVRAAIEANLGRLRAVEVVNVGRLLLDLPESSLCYSIPCSQSDPVVVAEYRRQAPRLARFTDLAAQIAGSADLPDADPAAAVPDLLALNSLAIVEIQGLLTIAPSASPYCYNAPCPEDVTKADAENRRRAAVVHALSVESLAEDI